MQCVIKMSYNTPIFGLFSPWKNLCVRSVLDTSFSTINHQRCNKTGIKQCCKMQTTQNSKLDLAFIFANYHCHKLRSRTNGKKTEA
jgi:hypothetical protein